MFVRVIMTVIVTVIAAVVVGVVIGPWVFVIWIAAAFANDSGREVDTFL